ncbi:MAG TPA: OmpA family protein [Candidatus Kapabacteria bacterium]|nr:OmpA family protein [Candidatus Kapabacteria bacterium]
MTKIIAKIIVLILFIVFYCSILRSQTRIHPYERITPEKVKIYDQFIRQYAPADSAYNLMLQWTDRQFIAARAAVAKYILEVYKPLFPGYKSMINAQILNSERAMLAQTPDSTMVAIYDDYIKSNAPSDDSFVAIQRLTDNFIQQHKYEEAIKIYQSYLPLFSSKKNKFDTIINILRAKNQGLIVRNLGKIINTPYSEWDPTLTPDGRYLYFSSDRKGGYGKADIWYSENINGQWTQAKNIGSKINKREEETVDNVSVDGTILFLSGEFPGTFGKFDIFLAEKDSLGWNRLLHINKPINSIYHEESANISSDGKVLIFTSDRPGGVGPFVEMNAQYYHGSLMGNMDLYISFNRDTGWTAPINMGNIINTPYAERAVFLHPDNKTLYFSSNGHTGLGGLDVFKSTRLDDTWLNWSEPVNLGKEINGESDDWGYSIDVKGDSALFAKHSQPDGYGAWDIYSIKLPKEAKPNSVITVRGKVTNSLGQPLAAVIRWEDLNTGEDLGFVKSDPKDGSYFISLSPDKLYGYFAEKKNYYPSSKNLDLRNYNKVGDFYADIELISLKEINDGNHKITINNIFFDYDKSDIKPESLPELNRLIEFLKPNKKIILIEGHTDNVGTKAYNMELSKKRAQSIADFLIKSGIDSSRIEVKGWGDTRPVMDNNSDESKSKNRRVEFSLH